MAALLLASAFAVLLLDKRQWNAGALIVAGDQYTDATKVPIPVERNSAGYDGQFYYRLARNPFTTEWTAFGVRLDVPTYRQQRILMPAIAWALSFGTAGPVPALFILINIASLALLAWTSATLLRDAGINVWWSAAVWLYPGWAITMTRDCSEILEVALLMSAALALRRRKLPLATLLATCAVLTKETALLGVVALAVGELAAAPLIVPISAHYALKFTLFRVWNAAPSLGTGHFVVPFSGLLHAGPTPFRTLWLAEVSAIAIIAVLAFVSLRRARLPPALAWAAYLPLIAILDQTFWTEDWSFMRATSEYWVFGGVIIAMASPRVRAIGVVVIVATWCAVAGHVAFVR